jgi:hypothetical protein
MDVEPEFLKSKLWGCIEGMFELREKSLVILQPCY